ncbi:dTMP kinase [Vulcanisaeta thermophila]|uniref:dTMP kinase n=1 Tax=Vulcanisaeta thermophila TaxID=867917 RepID=UPI001EE2D477|nr:dTMP kinase [Vulcanisaeta thermophila]
MNPVLGPSLCKWGPSTWLKPCVGQELIKILHRHSAHVARPLFIAVEGIDGVGKSTVINEVARRLRSEGIGVHVTSEPSQSPIGRLIRDWLLRPGSQVAHPSVFALLFVADRVQHYYGEVKPMLERGYLVITERYMESTLAYQGAMGLPMDWLESLHMYVPRPDLTIVLDAPIDVVMDRLRARQNLEIFEVNKDLLSRVRDLLLSRARVNGYPVINSVGDVDAVVNEVMGIIKGRLSGNNTLQTI